MNKGNAPLTPLFLEQSLGSGRGPSWSGGPRSEPTAISQIRPIALQFRDFVPTFIGDNDAPCGPLTPPQRGLYPLGHMPGSTIVGENMTALVLNLLTS